MTWFKRQSGELDAIPDKKVRTEGLWVKCEHCRQIIWKKDLEENLNVCPKCDKHFRIDARTRLAQLLDDNQYEVFDANLVSTDPLKFADLKTYSSRLEQAQAETGLKDAVINARGKLNGRPVIVSAMEYAFIGGSMGAVVGEMITEGDRARYRKQGSHHHRFGFGRGAHDGGRHQPDAIGQDFSRTGPAGRSQGSVHISADRSDHRRCNRVIRHAGRFEHR
jgi:acetyl-CoA carboxylase beta subunit